MRGYNKCECECFSRFAIIEFAISVLHTWGRVQAGQNAIIEFAISLKTRKRTLFTTHLNVGLRYIYLQMLFFSPIGGSASALLEPLLALIQQKQQQQLDVA